MVGDEITCTAIEAAFRKIFDDPVLVEKCSARDDSMIPVLPVGYDCALDVAHTRIWNAKQECHSMQSRVMMSTANFVVENISQRYVYI